MDRKGPQEPETFSAEHADSLFEGVEYRADPDRPSQDVAGTRTRSKIGTDPDTGEGWGCTDTTYVAERNGEIVSGRVLQVSKFSREGIAARFLIDVDRGGFISAPEYSAEPPQFEQQMADLSRGVEVLINYGREVVGNNA